MAPDTFLLGALLAGLTLYALLGGADFGAGAWQALLGKRMTADEREQVHDAVGPVWEANHVWLIFVFVILHTAFPVAFGAVARALWTPLLLGLLGIVLRGAAFAFRPRDPARRAERRAWETVFAFASVFAPFFLAAAAAALTEGRLPISRDGGFAGGAFAWVSPLSLYAGCLSVALCTHLTAVYLARESAQADDGPTLAVWRRRAILSGVATGAVALAGVGVVAWAAPALWEGFRARSVALVALSAVGGVGALLALVAGRYTLAAAGAGLAVACVLWGAVAGPYPLLVPPAIRVEDARAPHAVLVAASWSVFAGFLVLAPSLWFLFRVFKSARGRTGDRPPA
jgi:cytochrome bd ubiquinol oxidase subunit II